MCPAFWCADTTLGCSWADGVCVRTHTVELCPLTLGPRRLPGMVSAVPHCMPCYCTPALCPSTASWDV